MIKHARKTRKTSAVSQRKKSRLKLSLVLAAHNEVVNLKQYFSRWMMVPAPRKPIPTIIWAATRDASLAPKA
jgi:hypothetical protein